MKTLAEWSLVCVFALLWLLGVLTVPADSFAQGMQSPLSPIKPPTDADDTSHDATPESVPEWRAVLLLGSGLTGLAGYGRLRAISRGRKVRSRPMTPRGQ